MDLKKHMTETCNPPPCHAQAALEALRAEAAGLAPIICAQINEELGRPSGRKQPALASPKPSGQKNTLAQFQVRTAPLAASLRHCVGNAAWLCLRPVLHVASIFSCAAGMPPAAWFNSPSY